MYLFGKNQTKREILSRVGRLQQIGGIRRYQLQEGKEAGVDMIQVRTGAGLSFEICPSKGMDIAIAEYAGTSISWLSPNGNVHPKYYEYQGNGWLRTASGGLLMTCGLSHVGSVNLEDKNLSYGMHGRAHHLPAQQISIREDWIDDQLNWEVRGVMEETCIFGEKLRLTRTYSGIMGGNSIFIEDVVENLGFQPIEHMILYHFNFGYPLLDSNTKIILPNCQSEVRHGGEITLDEMTSWSEPDSEVNELVFYHHSFSDIDKDSMISASIVQPAFPIGTREQPLNVTLSWSADTLPNLVQWKMPGAGEHVLGIEPSNCRVEGREIEKKYGGPFILPSGDSQVYRLKLTLT